MNTYVGVVFSSDEEAHDALSAIWHLDEAGELTVHGAVIVRRDAAGLICIADRQRDIGHPLPVGVGAESILAFLANPAGLADGIGGAIIGTPSGAAKESHEDNANGFLFSLDNGQSTVLADISEDWTSVLDDAMFPLGGSIYRRICSDEIPLAAVVNGDRDNLCPYYYEPKYY
jgi:hypothetical protein